MKKQAKSISEVIVSKLVQNSYLPLSYLFPGKNPVKEEIDRYVLAGQQALAQGKQPDGFKVTITEKDNRNRWFTLNLGFQYEGSHPAVKSITLNFQGKSYTDPVSSGNLPSLKVMLEKTTELGKPVDTKERIVQPDKNKGLRM